MSRMLTLLASLVVGASATCAQVGVSYGSGVPNAGYTLDAAGCQMTCSTDPKCQVYTWKETSSPKGGCWHFNTNEPQKTMEPSSVSGPKVCGAGATLGNVGDLGDAVSGVNDAVANMNGEATAVANTLPTVPPLPKAADVAQPLPTIAPLPDAAPLAPGVLTDAVEVTTPLPENASIAEKVSHKISSKLSDVHNTVADIFSIDESKNHSQGPTFTVALILTVAAAFGLRICAHYSFNDYNNAVREEKNKKAKSSAAAKQAERDDAEAAATPRQSPMGLGSLSAMGAMGSGYQLVSGGQVLQAASPAGYQPVTYPVQPGGPYVMQ